ncbi:MAG TPA: D-glycerate dehydrogenase [Virgibacillus sp.]|nr:D-glycerate dehydrogenase [Virgibacillus sp.]
MKKPDIYITRKIPASILEPFRDRFHFKMWEQELTPVPDDVLKAETKQADGLLCLITDQIREQLFAESPQLQIVANMAVGYDHIDIQAATKHQVIVTNTPDVLTETTADLTFALLMATARRLVEANIFIRDDKWGDWAPFLLTGSDIHHQTIGIVGMGAIGQAVARRAKGFGMSILYHNRTRQEQAEQELGAQYMGFNDLLEQADFVISLVPLTDETTQMFNEAAFKRMKSSAIFINVSRGQTVDEDALYEALRTKEIKAAGLDVFKEEPIRANHPLVQLEQVVCLPHIGSASEQTRVNMLRLCLENLEGFFYGDGAKTPVNEFHNSYL